MNYKMKRLFQNISVSIFSLLLIFIILELAIRIVKGEYTFKNFTERKLSFPYQYDPYLGWIPKEGHWENQNIHGKTITILENGIRSNGDKTTKETAGLACILAVGDSFTFGDYVSDCETWPALLEKVSKGRVINGGALRSF